MKSARQVTAFQAFAVLVSTIVGVGILPLPLLAVRAADSGAPLVTFLGVLVALVGVVLIAFLGKRFPRQTLIQYSENIIGKWPARVASAALIVFFALLTAFAAREFGEVVITSVLRNTPVEVTVIVMLILACVSIRNDITTLVHIHFFYLPFIVVPALLIVALSLKNAEFINLQPFWGNEPRGYVAGTFTIANLFQGSFFLTAVIPSMRNPAKIMAASIWGILTAGGLYVAIVAASVGVFGAEETKNLLWPTLELAKTTSLPANILERLDAAFLAVWVTAVFTTLLSSYAMTIQSAANLFRLRDYRMLSVFILPMIFMVAMQPQSILEMYTTILNVGRMGLILTIGYPALLLAVALVRRMKGDADGPRKMDQTN